VTSCLWSDWVFNTDNAQADEVRDDLLFVVPVWFNVHMLFVRGSLACAPNRFNIKNFTVRKTIDGTQTSFRKLTPISCYNQCGSQQRYFFNQYSFVYNNFAFIAHFKYKQY